MMRGTMLIFRPGEREPEIKEIDFAPLSELDRLQWLKDGIGGGYLELVPYFKSIRHADTMRNCVAFCDEDGKRKNLPYNAIATGWWDISIRRIAGCSCWPDYLVGDIAVVFGDKEFMEAL
jgi:hypothetical protein